MDEGRRVMLHPTKTKIVDMNQTRNGFDFLGYHFGRTRGKRIARWPREKSEKKIKDGIREVTKRNNGKSLKETIAILNRKLKGWFEYFKHSNHSTFEEMDGWVRARLRSILKKRENRRGPAKGSDNVKWPKEYFNKMGLFNMEQTHRKLLAAR